MEYESLLRPAMELQKSNTLLCLFPDFRVLLIFFIQSMESESLLRPAMELQKSNKILCLFPDFRALLIFFYPINGIRKFIETCHGTEK
jgi:hypothetical protein